MTARQVYDSSKENWSALFASTHHQTGSGEIHTYIGGRPQLGGGIGGILRTLLRLIPSFIKSPVGQTLVTAGANIASDIQQGSTVRDALKTHARQGVRNLTGVGKRRLVKVRGSAGGRAIGFLRVPPPPKKRKAGLSMARVPEQPVRRAFIR